MLNQYIPVFILAVMGATIGIVILTVATLVRTHGLLARLFGGTAFKGKKDLDSYECGMESQGSAWVSSNTRFYVFALLFLIFDIEALFVFPWAVQMRELGRTGFIEVIIFAGILFVGLIYAWRKGVLKWR